MDDLAMLSYKQFIHFLLVNSLRNIRSAHYFLIFKLSKDFLFSLGLGFVQSAYNIQAQRYNTNVPAGKEDYETLFLINMTECHNPNDYFIARAVIFFLFISNTLFIRIFDTNRI